MQMFMQMFYSQVIIVLLDYIWKTKAEITSLSQDPMSLGFCSTSNILLATLALSAIQEEICAVM